MASVRTRLTLAYAAALTTSIGVFSGVLYVARSETSLEPLRRLLLAQADVATRVLRQGAQEGPTIIFVPDTTFADSTFRRLRPQLRGDVSARLDALPNYVVVLDATGQRVYTSPAANRLVPPLPDSTAPAPVRAEFNAAYAAYQDLLDAARQIRPGTRDTKLQL